MTQRSLPDTTPPACHLCPDPAYCGACVFVVTREGEYLHRHVDEWETRRALAAGAIRADEVEIRRKLARRG